MGYEMVAGLYCAGRCTKNHLCPKITNFVQKLRAVASEGAEARQPLHVVVDRRCAVSYTRV